MRRSKLDEAVSEAKRFIAKAEKLATLEDDHWEMRANGERHRWLPDPMDGSKESGAVRRASLDLTRALAEMRKA